LQKVELKATKVVHLGPCDNSAGKYPVAKKKQTLEYLREKVIHLHNNPPTIDPLLSLFSQQGEVEFRGMMALFCFHKL